MLPLDDLSVKIEEYVRGKRPYKTQAYLFILGALDYTMDKHGRRKNPSPGSRHVTGQELSFGIRDYAVTQFGPTAKMVLNHWGLTATADFGRIVYDLIDMGLLGKNDQDRIEDFLDVFDLEKEMFHHFRFNRGK